MFDIGTRINQIRKEKGITATYLAQKLSVSQSFISRIETGDKKCSLDLLDNICSILNISLAEFFFINKDDLSKLSPDTLNFVLKKENHGLFKLIRSIIDKGYTSEVIEEWIIGLDKTLENLKKKYNIPSTEDYVSWVDEEYLPESERGKYTEAEKQEIIDKVKEKLHYSKNRIRRGK